MTDHSKSDVSELVRVRELFWVRAMDSRYADGFHRHKWITNGCSLTYRISRRHGRRADRAGVSGKFRVECPGQGFFVKLFDTLDAAKAAAQDDFERRILACLTTSKENE